MAIIVNKNTVNLLDANTIGNSGSSGNWVIGTSLTHNNNLGSYADRLVPELIEGDTYRITYTATSYGSCQFRVALGSNEGTTRTANGSYTEVFIHSGVNKIRFWSNGIVTITQYMIEHLVTTVTDNAIDPTDISKFENKSWTLSYNPILEQWISFHSYLPNNYVMHPNSLLAKRNDTQVQLVNSGEYGKYFDNDVKPFIVETIFNEYPMETKVFDNIQSCIETRFGDIVTNKFFDEAIVYTESQCSGVVTLDMSKLTKKEKNWNFNQFLDITNNLTQSIFVKDWDNIASSFPIDKVVNEDKLDITKPWYQRGRMRDKYMAVRFIENNVDNNKIFCKFVSSYIRVSIR